MTRSRLLSDAAIRKAMRDGTVVMGVWPDHLARELIRCRKALRELRGWVADHINDEYVHDEKPGFYRNVCRNVDNIAKRALGRPGGGKS